MSRPWILVCPSSRGLGHALARHLLRTTPYPILATTRSSDASGLKKSLLPSDAPESYSSRLHTTTLDVTSESTIESSASRASELFPSDSHHLHLAFALPGTLDSSEKSVQRVDADNALNTFKVNVLGPLLLMKHFTDFMPRKSTQIDLGSSKESSSDIKEGEGEEEHVVVEDQGGYGGPVTTEKRKKGSSQGGGGGGGGNSSQLTLPQHATWLNVTARVGSTTDIKAGGGWFSYRASKAALNNLTKTYDWQLYTRSGDKAMAMAYHPGEVLKTKLSEGFWGSVKEEKLFTPEYAAEQLLDVATGKIGLDGRGRIWDYKGKEVPP